MPKISVIMAVHNERPDFLRKSIDSILGQSLADLELIIIDDGSNSENKKIFIEYAALDPRIILIKNEKNIGLTKSLNIAIRKSLGEFIARMDSDDVSLPSRLEKQLDYLLRNDLDLIGADCEMIDENGKLLKEKRIVLPVDIKKSMFKGNFFTHSTLFGRKRAFDHLYDERFTRAQDYEFLLRLLGKNFKLGHLPGSILKYRLNQEGISSKKAKEQEIFALRARLEALIKHGYSYCLIPHLARPILSFFLPYRLKHFIIYRLWK